METKREQQLQKQNDALRKVIEDEIKFLVKSIETSSSGGWSTHLNEPMTKRISQLTMALHGN